LSFYRRSPSLASAAADGWPPQAAGGGVIAIRVSDLRSPLRRPLREGDRTALTATGAGKIRTGDAVVFCKPVAVAAAVVRRNGRVQAAGHPADHARLGMLEQQLEEMTRPGIIDEIAAGIPLGGKVKGTARRSMTAALALRAVLLMTLMPEAGYATVMTALLGDLAAVPWHKPFTVPAETVLCTWREATGPDPLQRLQQMVLAAAAAEHEEHDYRAVHVGDLLAGSIDGSVTRMPDTPPNRAAYGSTGTGDDSAPYPQLRDLWISDASTRGTLGVLSGPSGGDKAEAEQALLDKALVELPGLFTPGRLWILDRNFPGVARIKNILATHTHVLIRLKSDIPVKKIGGFLPDGSYLAEISGGGHTVAMRVIEYDVAVAGQNVPELFCLVTDLRDHVAYPAADLAGAYSWRWPGSETALKEAKSAISGAGPSTGPMFRSGTPALIRQEHAAWVCATELVRAAGRAAARNAAPAAKGRRAGQPIHPREMSFTTCRRTAIDTITRGHATASLPAAAVRAARRHALQHIGKQRVAVDRNRHRDHKTKARQAFPNASRAITTRTAAARVSICGPLAT
jgi:hypothetical protein